MLLRISVDFAGCSMDKSGKLLRREALRAVCFYVKAFAVMELLKQFAHSIAHRITVMKQPVRQTFRTEAVR